MAFLPVMVVILAVAGCARGAPSSPAPVAWERLSPERLPADLRDWFDRKKEVRGTYVQHRGDRTFLLVAWGEKPTGGYQVRVTDILRGPRSVVAIVALTAPEPGQIVTEALTHPFDLVEAERLPEPITFAYQGQQTLTTPSAARPVAPSPSLRADPSDRVARFQVVQPAFGAVIRSPVRITGRASVFEGRFDIEIEDGHNVLATRRVTASVGAPGWGAFDVTIPFDKPTNPYGTIIFVTYSAKDGSRQENLLAPVRFEFDRR